MGFKKKEFTAYAIHSVPLPEDFQNHSLTNDSGTTFRQKLAEAKTQWAELQGKGEGFQMPANQQLRKRLKKIQDNMKHIRGKKSRGWGKKVFKNFDRVEVLEVVRDYSAEYVQWVQKEESQDWVSFETMEFFRNFAVAPITNEKEYNSWRDMLSQRERHSKYPIFRTFDGRYFCIRVVGSTTVALPFVTNESVEKMKIFNLEGVLLKETRTRKETVECIVEKSNENEYDATDLLHKLKCKINTSKRGNRKTKFEEPFPWFKKADREGRTRFILELVD